MTHTVQWKCYKPLRNRVLLRHIFRSESPANHFQVCNFLAFIGPFFTGCKVFFLFFSFAFFFKWMPVHAWAALRVRHLSNMVKPFWVKFKQPLTIVPLQTVWRFKSFFFRPWHEWLKCSLQSTSVGICL